MWFAVIGIVLIVTARPLARFGEASGAVLLGEGDMDVPQAANRFLLGFVRLMGLFVVGLALLW